MKSHIVVINVNGFYPHGAMLAWSLPSKDVCSFVRHTLVLCLND